MKLRTRVYMDEENYDDHEMMNTINSNTRILGYLLKSYYPPAGVDRDDC
jgi:hypothetical protein